MKPVLSVFCVLCVICLSGCERPEPPVASQAVRPAKLFKVTAQQTTVSHEFVGRLDAAQTLDVSFEVAGELMQLPVREGQAVAKGALVAALDPTNFQLAVREAEVQLRLATQDLQRKETLIRDRGISESVVDEARAQFELSQVRLSQAQKSLADSRIDAPFDAFVHIIDGEAEITISGNSITVKGGELVIMPANEPHALRAVEKFKMILIMIRQ